MLRAGRPYAAGLSRPLSVSVPKVEKVRPIPPFSPSTHTHTHTLPFASSFG